MCTQRLVIYLFLRAVLLKLATTAAQSGYSLEEENEVVVDDGVVEMDITSRKPSCQRKH
jgi:hypothetical protein